MLSRLRRIAAGRRRPSAPSPWDVDAFLDVARRSFVCVQQAWDRADLAALSAFAQGGGAVLLVTHEADAAAAAGRNIRMEKGRIISAMP